MELFFTSSPIGLLLGLTKEKSLYSLSRFDSKKGVYLEKGHFLHSFPHPPFLTQPKKSNSTIPKKSLDVTPIELEKISHLVMDSRKKWKTGYDNLTQILTLLIDSSYEESSRASDLAIDLSQKGTEDKRDNKALSISLKSLDKTYFIDLKEAPFFKQNCFKQISPSPLVKKVKKEIDLFFRGKLKQFSIPVYKKRDSQRGTHFQQKVWKALQNIPYGKTKTYSDIAKLIKKPKAYRAVGTAVGKNPCLIINPCHRVLSKNSLGGFALGLKIKQQLLNLEKKV